MTPSSGPPQPWQASSWKVLGLFQGSQFALLAVKDLYLDITNDNLELLLNPEFGID